MTTLAEINAKRVEMTDDVSAYKQAVIDFDDGLIVQTELDNIRVVAQNTTAEYSQLIYQYVSENPTLNEDDVFSDPIKLSQAIREEVKRIFRGNAVEVLPEIDPFLEFVNLHLDFDDEVLDFALESSVDFTHTASAAGLTTLRQTDSQNKRVYSKCVAGTGKVVFEFKVIKSTTMFLGFTHPQCEVYNTEVGYTPATFQESLSYCSNGDLYAWDSNDLAVGDGFVFGDGSVVTFYVDIDAGTFNVYHNGTLAKSGVFPAGVGVKPAASTSFIDDSVEFRRAEANIEYFGLENGYEEIALSGHTSTLVRNRVNNANLNPLRYAFQYPYSTKSAAKKKSGLNSWYVGDIVKNRAGMIRWGSTGSLGSDDFTIECWFWLDNFRSSNPQDMMGDYKQANWGAYSWGLIIFPEGSVAPEHIRTIWFASGLSQLHSVDKVVAKEWTHVALVRKNGVLSMYLNGKFQDQIPFTNIMENVTAIGTDWNGRQFFGYVDSIRVTKVARYDNDFIPQIY